MKLFRKSHSAAFVAGCRLFRRLSARGEEDFGPTVSGQPAKKLAARFSPDFLNSFGRQNRASGLLCKFTEWQSQAAESPGKFRSSSAKPLLHQVTSVRTLPLTGRATRYSRRSYPCPLVAVFLAARPLASPPPHLPRWLLLSRFRPMPRPPLARPPSSALGMRAARPTPPPGPCWPRTAPPWMPSKPGCASPKARTPAAWASTATPTATAS